MRRSFRAGLGALSCRHMRCTAARTSAAPCVFAAAETGETFHEAQQPNQSAHRLSVARSDTPEQLRASAPEKIKRTPLVDFPASGSEKGKYASAWIESQSRNCASGTTLPDCFEAKAVLSGKVLNAVMDAVSAGATIGHYVFSPSVAPGFSNIWSWGYYLNLFGTTIVNRNGAVATSTVAANALVGQPVIDDRAPFTARGVKNFEIDLGSISSYLGWLPDATVTINYAVNGASTTKVELAPFTPYGPLANLDLQPRAQMTASGRGSWGVNLLNIGLVNAEIGTEGESRRSHPVATPRSTSSMCSPPSAQWGRQRSTCARSRAASRTRRPQKILLPRPSRSSACFSATFCRSRSPRVTPGIRARATPCTGTSLTSG